MTSTLGGERAVTSVWPAMLRQSLAVWVMASGCGGLLALVVPFFNVGRSIVAGLELAGVLFLVRVTDRGWFSSAVVAGVASFGVFVQGRYLFELVGAMPNEGVVPESALLRVFSGPYAIREVSTSVVALALSTILGKLAFAGERRLYISIAWVATCLLFAGGVALLVSATSSLPALWVHAKVLNLEQHVIWLVIGVGCCLGVAEWQNRVAAMG